MITCNACGAENPAGSVYCEDCGAQLQASDGGPSSRSGPLAIGCELAGRYRIESLVESGPILRYHATFQSQKYLLWESRRSGSTSQLSRQRELLGGISGSGFLQPGEFFSVDEFDYAAIRWPGTRLEDLVAQQGVMPPADLSQCLLQLLALVQVLHQQGLLSRSIQPSRVWRNPQGDWLLDLWERSCAWESPRDAEEVCSITPGFSAPEMYGLGVQDQRLDLFSLAALGYFSLTGQRLNLDSRESFFVIPPPRVEGAEELVRVLMKGLRKSPEERFPSAEAMRQALLNPEPTAAGQPLVSEPLPAPVPKAGPASSPNGRVLRPQVSMLSHIGCVRSINQDACLELRFTFFEKSRRFEGWLVTVIDGMGGEAEGDKAASLALRTLAQELVAADLSVRDGRQTTVLLPDDQDQRCHLLLERALRVANRTIYDYASLDEARKGMGCTITACLLAGSKAYFAQVGDTRGYHGREQLQQVTTDHSLVSRLVAMGNLTPEGARLSPQRSIIYRALGTSPDVEVDLFERELQPGDRIVLCSDGVWEYFEAQEFERYLMAAQAGKELCQTVVDLCLERGADDNATIAVIQC